MNEIKSRSYTLRTDNGSWLGQIVLTSDGMFASVTDYGNLSYAWRNTGEKDFRKFICQLDVHYFTGKLQNGLSYITYDKKSQKSCELFSEKILPTLQKVLNDEIEKGIEF